ncbi:MAG: NTP transferase domain-containing protein [Coriobacteriales bacterium]|nr:NTP transferase domain-containing protein [Coriobacteriales bacterium]
MSLTKNEFQILEVLSSVPERFSQRKLATASGLSLGTVNATLAQCTQKGLLDGYTVTDKGYEELEPYTVDNAVIMAAGLSSRFAPISYEKPKGLLRVRGEVLIERQIEQLLERGISDITVVVGYKKEYFFYLRSKYGVRIVVNPDYATKNNVSTLWRVRHLLGNTYICSSDIYYEENPFKRHVYQAYYASEHVDGPTNEWCMTTNKAGRITKVVIGGSNADIMLGEAYFDRTFSRDFVALLKSEYTNPETDSKLWEDLYVEHIKDFDMVIKLHPRGTIHEFDSLDELRGFDPDFIQNVDSDIFNNIVSVLGCDRSQIHDFYPLVDSLTNLSCHFAVGDDEYVYRHPGVGTEKMIDRAGEEAALRLAKELGLDSTFVYEDQKKGWKISSFVKNARQLDPHDPVQLERAMTMCRQLHECGATLERKFDFWDEGLHYEDLLLEFGPIDVPGYYELKEKVGRLRAYAAQDGYEPCISHNDFFYLNFLLDEDDNLNLIDWEYAGMSDPANDFGTFSVCCELSEDEANQAIDFYFGRPATFEERRHFWVFVVLAGWCWYVWSLEKEEEGDNIGEWLYIYYSYAVDYVDKILSWYEQA